MTLHYSADEDVGRFALLLDGRRDAYGTGEGRWIREPVSLALYKAHLRGEGPGLGLDPLLRDGTVRFAAVNLNESDLRLAQEVASFLPGTSWIERSHSGNAHVWAFFDTPVAAWIPRGIMLSALQALGHKDVEVLPDASERRFVNLPYYGGARPMVDVDFRPSLSDGKDSNLDGARAIPRHLFLKLAERSPNSTDEWERRARALELRTPEDVDNLVAAA